MKKKLLALLLVLALTLTLMLPAFTATAHSAEPCEACSHTWMQNGGASEYAWTYIDASSHLAYLSYAAICTKCYTTSTQYTTSVKSHILPCYQCGH